MNRFISWVGGKYSLRKEILKRFPQKFNKYVEVFGGAAWILFYKEQKGYEVYNDYNSELVNLFKIEKVSRINNLSMTKNNTFNELLISNY